ncbi:myb/SANT-like DNA-binding domain-containing protein 3 [Schistocerca piceifrons]|uniref:myb/SANT-like DNA-binding domain-containing protein 3 n=1 Tax=Schistocerca piceifrons TaxID=274613 RepID=UPI001F5EEE29|nr:myb/SANT-like DNA-binding domain-containing protein 3 [Schistocerca piceifrons]
MENKKRTPNFSKFKVDILLELVASNSSILDCKKTDGCTVMEKLDAWENIATQFNATPGVTKRRPERLKTCYENLKRMLRKDLAEEKIQVYKKEGGKAIPVPKKSPHESKLLEIVGSSLKLLENTFDLDAQYSVIMDLNVGVADDTAVGDASSTTNSNGTVIVAEAGESLIPAQVVMENVQQPFSTPSSAGAQETCNRRRMPPRRKPTSSSAPDSVMQKRVEVLQQQLEMMKREHMKDMRI